MLFKERDISFVIPKNFRLLVTTFYIGVIEPNPVLDA